MLYHHFAVRSKTDWDAFVLRSLIHEAYHTWHYHTLNSEGEPVLFVYEEGPHFIALPLIKRKIENSEFFDVTSIYGYGGPISNLPLSDIPDDRKANFKKSFQEFMDTEQCICVFSRLHPFIAQDDLLSTIGGVCDNGSTIYMDLSLPIEIQRSNYDKRLWRQIRKLRSENYIIKEAESEAEIRDFTMMYHKNMERLSAAPNYYFDYNYFVGLLNSKELDNKLILIYDGQKLICGALLLVSSYLIRNHLSATAQEYINESPSKLLTDEISLIGRKVGAKIFHLGGGVGGKEDSLFKFKSHFSNTRIRDQIWCFVSNNQAYNELVEKRSAELNPESRYFPIYRQVKQQTF
ncbi:GNAT family N-acetyltransferase [Pedobacter sp. MC2016-24]|uniref:GNAT family N-acetyltransferase n=1 Tax=Pedobacter sp. MC2016-24 TaxID=2780090 RepID=UPI0018815746|nr:GNAT family N-acetyltransferase [Pedobacter sp. MC2016-24]MBE9601667.1 GNAT family N-acetyltransferase [Pedobacter sp. MC2016-24]